MSIDHTQLAMPQGREDDARAFWTSILGMTEEAKPLPLKKRGGCRFRKDGVIVHVGADSNFKTQEKAHPAFVVSELESLATSLNENGYPVAWDNALSDRKRCFSEDPFGNRLEFMKDGNGFSQK